MDTSTFGNPGKRGCVYGISKKTISYKLCILFKNRQNNEWPSCNEFKV